MKKAEQINVDSVLQNFVYDCQEPLESIGVKSFRTLSDTVRDWFGENGSIPDVTKMILTHPTLNDNEKIAGVFLLGALLSAHMLAHQQAKETVSGLLADLKDLVK